MWLLILEAFLAVALLALIVWWTMGPVRKRESTALERSSETASARADGKTDKPED